MEFLAENCIIFAVEPFTCVSWYCKILIFFLKTKLKRIQKTPNKRKTQINKKKEKPKPKKRGKSQTLEAAENKMCVLVYQFEF